MSPEIKAMLGHRERDDDGFTYRYGKHKGGFNKKPRHNAGIDRGKRNDKRAARQAEGRRIALESDSAD